MIRTSWHVALDRGDTGQKQKSVLNPIVIGYDILDGMNSKDLI